MNPEKLFLEHLGCVQRAAQMGCRRYRMTPEDTEDFVSEVQRKLLENDYEVIRKFRSRNGAKLSTYLTTVVQRALLDYVNHLWGKWRPSAEAKRHGPEAILLDRLMTRDGLTFDEACEIMQSNHGVKKSPQELYAIAVSLPRRYPRRVEGAETLEHHADPDVRTDQRVIDRERGRLRARVMHFLDAALESLDPADKLLLRLHGEQRNLAALARQLRRPYRSLYRQLQGIWTTLRETLEKEGITGAQVAEIVGPGPWDEV